MSLHNATQSTFGDLVQPFQIEAPGLRGRLVRLGPALDAAMARHAYPAAVAGMLAETLALAAVLASGLKYDGVFTLQTQSDGPLDMLIADVTSDGDLRGYARYDPERIAPAADAAGGPVPRLLGAGHLAFTVDQGPDTDRYQGITGLEGATLADCAHNYFRQSEQMDSAIKLVTADNETAARAAALMIQRLPPAGGTAADADAAAEEWIRAVALMSSVTADEMLDDSLTPAELLYRLFHEDGVRVFRPRALRHTCRCSQEKVENTLKSFPRSEVEAMAEDGTVVVTCEFCKADYGFDEAKLDALYAGA
jgi:molecular chaperone Hsp33